MPVWSDEEVLEADPHREKPTFTELVATLDKTLMSVAGYTELGTTLVEGRGRRIGGLDSVEPPHEADQDELLAS